MFSIAFAAYNQSSKQLTINLAKGWNLIPIGFESPDNISNDALAVYVWISPLAKYVGGILKNGSVAGAPDYSQTLNTMKDYAPPAMWVYMKKEVTVTSYATTNNQLFTGEGAGKKLARGWNFVAIWPYMVGIDIKDLFSSCTITKANIWQSETQSWQQSSSIQAAQNLSGAIKESDVGSSIIVYAASNCELSLVGAEAMTPPALPD